MNWKHILQTQFGEVILDAKEENIDGLIALDITVKHTQMEQVNNASRQINEFLDTQNIDRFDTISIHSPGLELNYTVESLSDHVGEDLKIKLVKAQNKTNELVSNLLEVNEQEIVVKWNQKGNIRKITIDKGNIASVEKHIKF
ncbi:ribosome assembly cofactor RimP [Mycoplasma simbae]|uniref:ribosome assembly cofactor RimP n=1 Tax=Mycoplasma simbae TaxID=36744 RepID=UPI0004980F58|nr:ribosome assembly cofactor RimP [Mycoplasma simbae]